MRTGINAQTGQVLTGWDHTVQSINRCLRRRFNTVPLRRHWGCEVPELQDENADPMTIFRLFGAIAEALADPECGERGVRLTGIEVAATPRIGRFAFILSFDEFPFGHLGNFELQTKRQLTWSPDEVAA